MSHTLYGVPPQRKPSLQERLEEARESLIAIQNGNLRPELIDLEYHIKKVITDLEQEIKDEN